MTKIIGNTTTTPMAVPDWNQTDAKKADYIKNKPAVLTETEIKDLIDEFGGTTTYNKLRPTFTEDTTYTDYLYKGTILIDGITADTAVEVVFNLTDATSGNYAPIAETFDGGVYIYAKVDTLITIPSIIVLG